MKVRKVGMVCIIILFISISTAGINFSESDTKNIRFQESEEFPVRSFNYTGSLTCYSAPDSSYAAFGDLLDTVNSSLYISVYEIQNIHLAKSISNLSDKGVNIRLLVESDPVSGISQMEKYCLDLMDSNGVKIKNTDSKNFNYDYLHSKYIVADNNSVLISSENFGYTGYPIENTNGNRGWGVIVHNKKTANHYKDLFYHDWNNSKEMNIEFKTVIEKKQKLGSYSPEFEIKTIEDKIKVKPVFCPDHSLSKKSIIKMIEDAEEKIYVQQFYIDDWNKNPYLNEILNASKRGCEVKFLLDSTWYNIKKDEKDNDDFKEYINNYSEEHDLNMECRLINRYHGFSKAHNKGMIVDGEKVLISSINWNLHSINHNREVGIIIENKDAASYYQDIFLHDWDDDLIKPIPEAGQDKTVIINKKIKLDAFHSWDDDEIVKYQWDLDGDGYYDKEGKTINHTFKKEGEHKIQLKVTDGQGHESIDRLRVTVEKNKNSSTNLYYLIILIPIVVSMGIIYNKRYKD